MIDVEFVLSFNGELINLENVLVMSTTKIKMWVSTSASVLTLASLSALSPAIAQTSEKPSDFTSRVAGFIQLDQVNASSDNIDWDDSTVRRARIGFRGNADKNWKYDLMFEAGSGTTVLFDANLTYTGFDFATVRLGQFKEPVGLEWSTGAPWWTFSDRALVASLTPKRSTGVAVSKNGKKWGAHIGYFNAESTIPNSPALDSATTGRAYWVPVKTDKDVVHLGFSVVSRTPETGTTRIKAKHETAAQPSPSMDSGTIDDVSTVDLVGLEALILKGPFSVQGEYYNQTIERNTAPSVDLQASYVQVSYFLTGERRPYNIKRGGFGRIKPKAESGAVEIAARFDQLDLSDTSISAGTMERLTLGVNWYVNKRIRLNLNYVGSQTDQDSRFGDTNTQSIGLRSQFTF